MSYFTAYSVWWRTTSTFLYCWLFYDTITLVARPDSHLVSSLRKWLTSLFFVSIYAMYCALVWYTALNTWYFLYDRNWPLANKYY